MKALEDFMYKGKHVRGGDEVAVDAKDIPKLVDLGKILDPGKIAEPVKKKADSGPEKNEYRHLKDPDIEVEDGLTGKDRAKLGSGTSIKSKSRKRRY